MVRSSHPLPKGEFTGVISSGAGRLVLALLTLAGCEKVQERLLDGLDAGLTSQSPSDEQNDKPPKSQDAGTLASCSRSEANLLPNACFDGDATGWRSPSADALSWRRDGRSADESRSSGSLSVSMELTGNEDNGAARVVGGVERCVPVAPETTYQLAAQYLITPEAPESTRSGLAMAFYASADCEGDVLSTFTSRSGTVVGSWSRLTETFSTPSRVRSLVLRLQVYKDYADEDATVFFDELSLLRQKDAAYCSVTSTRAGGMGAPESNVDESEPPLDAGNPQNDDSPTQDPFDASVVDPMDAAPPQPTLDAGSTEEVDDPSEPTDPPDEATEPTEPPPAGPSYAETVEPLFVTSCVTACHMPGGLGGPGRIVPDSEIDLSSGIGYAQLTGTTSLQRSDLPFVGESVEESYLWLKLVNSPEIEGVAMPFAAPALDAAQLEVVRAWIEGGAEP